MRFNYSFTILCALFLVYSFLGWIIEVLVAFKNNHKFINRGFLMGPLVPIWGMGAILITLILKPYDSIFNLIVSSAFIGTFLEYVVNYVMEKMFKVRWWDYSCRSFNINGRVCLRSSISFGVGGLLVIKFINPRLVRFFESLNPSFFSILVIVLIIIVLTDFCVSFNIIQKLKISADNVRKDYTEEISKKVRAVLMSKSSGFKRLLNAFPNIKFTSKR